VRAARRRNLLSLAGVVVLAVVLVGLGYLVVHARAAGGGTLGPLTDVSVSPASSSRPSVARTSHWIVAKVTASVVARTQPSASAPVRATFGTRTANGFPTLFLVSATREVAGRVWYRVWLPRPPNESRGWIAEGRLATYPTTTKIVIDISRRRLTVLRADHELASFPVAVGTPQYPTPTGSFYVCEKLRPPRPGGPYGVLALSLSAFQPKLSFWEGGGQVAIHGTNQDQLIGQAVSHGCVRMHNADILKVSGLVPAGSPVVIQP
jgi:lipoprotein-anchoring transpeptidase ErfK/SrfK